jgi:CRP/FNR family transcriptional regulator, cyclic AMP receptor protein
LTVEVNGTQSASRVRLLAVEPDIGRFLTEEERAEAARLSVPVLAVGQGRLHLERRLREAGAFGAVVLDGALMHRLVLGDHPTLRLLGPGDVLSREGETGLGMVLQSTYRSLGDLWLALLDDHVLAAGQHIPRLMSGLYVRMGEQHQRLATQLVICQLPRVDQRILGMLWLLADTWGRVTPSGTVLPVALTHDALGECIGARRPTVSLALKELTDRGALLRTDEGWLLLETMPLLPDGPPPRIRANAIDTNLAAAAAAAAAAATWRDDGPQHQPEARSDALMALVATLRESHTQAQRDVRRRLAASRRLRERNLALREQIVSRKRRRRQAP